MEHRLEPPKSPQACPTRCVGLRENSPAHRKSSLSSEREILPCITTALNFPVQARQNPSDKHTDYQDGCSNNYRTKDSKEVDLSLKNTSMFTIFIIIPNMPNFNSIRHSFQIDCLCLCFSLIKWAHVMTRTVMGQFQSWKSQTEAS